MKNSLVVAATIMSLGISEAAFASSDTNPDLKPKSQSAQDKSAYREINPGDIGLRMVRLRQVLSRNPAQGKLTCKELELRTHVVPALERAVLPIADVVKLLGDLTPDSPDLKEKLHDFEQTILENVFPFAMTVAPILSMNLPYADHNSLQIFVEEVLVKLEKMAGLSPLSEQDLDRCKPAVTAKVSDIHRRKAMGISSEEYQPATLMLRAAKLAARLSNKAAVTSDPEKKAFYLTISKTIVGGVDTFHKAAQQRDLTNMNDASRVIQNVQAVEVIAKSDLRAVTLKLAPLMNIEVTNEGEAYETKLLVKILEKLEAMLNDNPEVKPQEAKPAPKRPIIKLTAEQKRQHAGVLGDTCRRIGPVLNALRVLKDRDTTKLNAKDARLIKETNTFLTRIYDDLREQMGLSGQAFDPSQLLMTAAQRGLLEEHINNQVLSLGVELAQFADVEVTGDSITYRLKLTGVVLKKVEKLLNIK